MEAKALDFALRRNQVLRAVEREGEAAFGSTCLLKPRFSLNISRSTTRGQIWLYGEGAELGLHSDLPAGHQGEGMGGGFDQNVFYECTKL